MPGTRKLGRATDARKAMLRAMVTYLLENGKIETTVMRAREVRPMAEKMITLGKANTLHTKRQALHTSPRKTSSRNSSTKSLRSMQTATAATAASPNSARAVVTALKWRSLNWSNQIVKIPGTVSTGDFFWCLVISD